MKFLTTVFVLSLHLLAQALANRKEDASSSLAVTADVTSDVNNDKVNEGSSPLKSGSKVFIPSSDWKVVDEDDVIFNGLHYRINLATGLKEAKLLDGSDGSKYLAAAKRWLQARGKKRAGSVLEAEDEELLLQEYGGNFASVLVDEAGDHDSFLANVMKIDDSSSSGDEQDEKDGLHAPKPEGATGRKFRSYEELKRELADLNLLMESEQNVVAKKILAHLNLTSVSEELESLADLEYLLHNSDNALAFIDNGGFERVLLPSLTSAAWEVRRLGCRLVSACVQNFARAQIAAHEAGLLTPLLSLLAHDQKTSVKSAALSGISSLVRHFPLAQQQLVALGLEAMRATLFMRSDAPPALRWKTVKLLSDLLMERQGEQGQVSPDRLEQLAAVNLETSLATLGWCSFLVQEFKILDDNFAALPIERDQRSALEALLQAAESSGKLCADDLLGALPLLRLLQDKLRAERPHLGERSDDTDQHDADDDGAYDEELTTRILHVVKRHEEKARQEL